MDPGYQQVTPALLFPAILYYVQCQAVIMFIKAKLKNHLVPPLLAVRQHVRLCFAPRKAYLLIKRRKHFQQCCLLGKSWQHC